MSPIVAMYILFKLFSMKAPITIREIKIEDTDSIISLNNELGYALGQGHFEKQLSEIINTKDHYLFAATINDSIIGYIHGFKALRLTSAPFIEIGALVVKKEFRRKGIGRRLVGFLEEYTQNIGSLRVRCNVKRQEAHNFYIKLNYLEKKEQKIFQKNRI